MPEPARVVPHVDQARVDAALAVLTDTSSPAKGLPDTLAVVVQASHQVFGLAGAGVMVFDEAEVLRYVAASDESAHLLETSQEKAGTGPCVDAAQRDELTWTADVTADSRWPDLAPLLADAPVRGVLGIPIHVQGRPVGSLNVYTADAYEWDESDRSALAAFGAFVDHALEASLAGHQSSLLVQQLQHALESRVTIERAVGLLMGRDQLDADAAFERIRTSARRRRLRVAALAQMLLDRGPDELSELA